MNPVVMPDLHVKEISDLYTRTNFQNLVDFFSQQNQFAGFNFLEINESGPVTNKLIAHGLGYIPKDISLTRNTGAGTITFNYGSFDKTNISYSTTGAVNARFYVGTHNGG